MGKVIIHTTMSLDGFIAKPNDDVAWGFNYGTDRMMDEIMKEIGAVVMGNRSVYLSENGLPYGGTVKVPQFVVTHTPRNPVTIGGLTFEFVDNLEHAVEQAKTAAGEKSVTLLGASIDQQALNAGLVDEIMIHLAPILIGDGIRLFDNLKARDIEFERTELVATGGITSLRFRIINTK
jgi:dihydrofolate reductase